MLPPVLRKFVIVLDSVPRAAVDGAVVSVVVSADDEDDCDDAAVEGGAVELGRAAVGIAVTVTVSLKKI